MPRILVADDNSNIHRTVALAFKDAGVEVVAVGNGEAAVRKIAEMKPDLVLADIFMPVRNGYEVCEFVKKDPRFAQTPVVLLIGAFDPFDEREAQRVQADGILKKPFVPPDSLLRMVADLLAQSAAKTAPVAVVAAVGTADRAEMAGRSASGGDAESAGFTDAAPEEFTPAKARLEWSTANQPVAFSTLLETPLAEAEDSVVTAQRDPTLGEPAFWTETAQPAEPAEESGGEDAQEGGEATALEQVTWGAGPKFEPLIGEPAGISEVETPVPGLASLVSDPEVAEAAGAPSQAAEAASELWTAPSPELPTLPALEQSLPALSGDSALGSQNEILPEIPGFGGPALEVELEQLAAPDLKDFSWATPSAVPDKPEQGLAPKLTDELIEAMAPGLATLEPLSAPPEAEPAEKFDFEPLSEFRPDASVAESSAPTGAAAPSNSDPAAIEAVVSRVIERMQPKIIELVTRELLRPVVEALVQRELGKK